jgi:hypothetical protein
MAGTRTRATISAVLMLAAKAESFDPIGDFLAGREV